MPPPRKLLKEIGEGGISGHNQGALARTQIGEDRGCGVPALTLEIERHAFLARPATGSFQADAA